MFAIMTTLWCWTFSTGATDKQVTKKIFIVIAILSLSYGIAMELIQDNFISNRSFDIGDIIADGVGAIIGAFYSWGRYIKK